MPCAHTDAFIARDEPAKALRRGMQSPNCSKTHVSSPEVFAAQLKPSLHQLLTHSWQGKQGGAPFLGTVRVRCWPAYVPNAASAPCMLRREQE